MTEVQMASNIQDLSNQKIDKKKSKVTRHGPFTKATRRFFTYFDFTTLM